MKRLTPVAWTLVVEATSSVTGAITFWLLAEQFDPEIYGLLGGVIALAVIAAPIVSSGALPTMTARVARRDHLRSDVGTAISTTLTGTLLGCVVLSLVQPWIFSGIDYWTVFLLFLGQITMTWLTELAVGVTLALGDQRRSAEIRVATSLLRLIGLVGYLLVADEATLRGWAVATVATGALSVLLAQAMLVSRIGGFPQVRRPRWSEFSHGFAYGLGATAEGVLDATDRPLLLRYDYRADAGLYSAGYRIIGLTYIPLLALMRSVDRQLWKSGAEGIQACLQLTRRLITRTLPVSVLLGVTFAVLADWLIRILPESYLGAAPIMRLLAVLPVIRAVQFPLGNVFTMTGRAKTRLALTAGAAALNLGLNLLWIPKHSWRGALWATIIAEVALTLVLLAWLRVLAKREVGLH